jgi:hypothetical protein
MFGTNKLCMKGIYLPTFQRSIILRANEGTSLYVNYIVPPHSGLESAISITFIYLFIIDDKLVCLLNAFQISIQMLQLQRFITCLIITKYDLRCLDAAGLANN